MSPPVIYIGVIDDDESFCRSLGRLLRAARYQPVTYPSAEAFLADDKRPRFDCLVLDVKMGGMSGIELQRRLAAVGSTTPVIFLSAHDDGATREAARGAGGAAFVSKVQSSDSLLSAIDSVLGGRDDRPN